MSKNTIKKKEGLQKGGDGYVINPSIAIAGMPGHTRYSYNLIPVFSGELLEDGNGYNTEIQNGGGIKKNKQNCECNIISKKEKSVFDLIKLQRFSGGFVPNVESLHTNGSYKRLHGGNTEIANISQFGAIQSVSKILQPLGVNNLLSIVMLLFLFHLNVKKPKKSISIQSGGYVKELEKILAPLGKNNLLVLSSLLLLHHFATLSPETNKKSGLLFGGSELTTSIIPTLSKLLAPLGVNVLGTSVVLVMLYDAFVSERLQVGVSHKLPISGEKSKIKKGGNPLKNLIAPLGTNSFIATGILIILGKIFLNKVIELDKNIIDEKKKMKGGEVSKKNYEKLVNILSPISFNSFATESFLNKMSK
jgi:hypothetical protein